MPQIISAEPSSPTLKRLVCVKGFKSPIDCWEPFIGTMAEDHGFNTTLLGFDHGATDSTDFIATDPVVAKEFITDCVMEPVHRDHRVLLAHSWGATCVLDLLSRDETAFPIVESFRGIILVTPFMGAVIMNDWGYGPLARRFSKAQKGKLVGSTPIETWGAKTFFRRTAAAAADLTPETTPYHSQASALNLHALGLHHRIKKNGGLAECAREIPITVVIGTGDAVCRNDYIRQLIAGIQANPLEFDADHYLLLNSPDAQEAIAERATGMMRLGMRAPLQHVKPYWPTQTPIAWQGPPAPPLGELAVA